MTTTETTYTGKNGKVHIAREILSATDAKTRLSDSDHWATGAVITACKLSLPLGEGETKIPGEPVTCGNCKRAKPGLRTRT